MSNRPKNYRKVEDFSFEGRKITGLKRRPDGRFYAAALPSKTFGKDPRQAVMGFLLWQAKITPGSSTPPHFEFWRLAFRRLIGLYPKVAAEVLEIPKLADLDYDPFDHSLWKYEGEILDHLQE